MSQPAHAESYGDAIARGYLPIREVAALTGVNPVTLRAWERRYGLIVPHRTSKGHRLYSPEQVRTVQAVLGWLGRGVSVGQVKGLLQADQPLPAEQASRWQDRRERLALAIERFDERLLDESFNAELALYPPQILCQHLLQPLLQTLERRWRAPGGVQTERLFLQGWLRSKLGARVYHDNRQHQGASLLLVNLDPAPLSIQLWLCAWLISTAGCPVHTFDAAIPAAEVDRVLARLQPRAVVLFDDSGHGDLSSSWLRDLQRPCLLVTPHDAVSMTQAAGASANPDLTRLDDALAALQVLADRHLLE